MKERALNGRIAIVTGASRGLGEGIAKAFAREGATVALFSRDLARLHQHEAALTASGAKAAAFRVDVANAGEVEGAVKDVRERFGPADILVNNAAIAPSVPFVEMTEERRDEVIDINIKGTWNCARSVLPSMIERGYGKIINVSSVTGPLVSGKGVTAYSASKGAVSGFTRSLALEVAEHGINVNTICPGTFDTPMMRGIAQSRGADEDQYLRDLGRGMPFGRLGTMDEMGDLAVFLASDASSYITGAEIVIDGGNIIQEHKHS